MALCAVLMLSGCGRGSHPAAPGGGARARHASAAGNAPTVAAQTIGMVEAASPVKSTVPVRLKFELLQRPSVGAPLPIDFALVPLVAADAATVEIVDSTDFSAAAADRQFTVHLLDAGKVYRRSLTVTPTVGGGVSQLDLAVTMHRDGIDEVRKFTVPIIVAGGSAAAAAAASAAGAPSAASAAK